VSAAPHCCEAMPRMKRPGVRTGNSSHSLTLKQRFVAFVKWIVPGGILVLLPKCPMCIAAYIALGTGVGISATAAAWLRIALVALCVISMSYLVARSGRRWMARIVLRH
jgi:hypothetical protein